MATSLSACIVGFSGMAVVGRVAFLLTVGVAKTNGALGSDLSGVDFPVSVANHTDVCRGEGGWRFLKPGRLNTLKPRPPNSDTQKAEVTSMIPEDTGNKKCQIPIQLQYCTVFPKSRVCNVFQCKSRNWGEKR